MDTGDRLDLEILDVAHGGVFVARHRGRVVFVPDVLPGERVRVRLTDTRKAAFWRAEPWEILEASPHRRPHIWPAADVGTPPDERPGGADFGHIDLDHQRELKRRVIDDAMRRVGHLDLPVTIEPAGADESPDASRWRTRVSLHVGADGRVGPYAARSHRVIPVDRLPLVTAAVEEAAASLGAAAPGRVDLVQPADGEVRLVPRPDGGAPQPDPAHERIVERVGAREFALDARGFWQVHRLAAAALTRIVTEMLADSDALRDPQARHLDLYGGVGLFAAALSAAAVPGARVTSVESDARASAHAAHNLGDIGAIRTDAARVDRWLARWHADASGQERRRVARGVTLLDPPRSGAGVRTVGAIADLAPAQIVYVACDPVALARDLRAFQDRGYEAARVRAVDLFPHSHHVEAVALLARSAPHASLES